MEEAKMANFRDKKHLRSSRLEWGSRSEGPSMKPEKATTSTEVIYKSNHCSLKYFPGDNVEEILERLKPYENLKRIYIKGYPGRKFPSWNLPYLVVVVMIDCRRCKNMPSLGQLSLLQSLFLQGMDAVEHFSEEIYGADNARPFPSLKDLTLRDFPFLEVWSCNDKRPAFPCLKRLILDKCPCLKSAPTFPSLQHLVLQNCNAQIMNSLEDITSLSRLTASFR